MSLHHLFRPLAAFTTFLSLGASAATLYVDLNSTNPVSPYSAWASAATNIQDAVDAAVSADTILVTNGVYDSGARAVFDQMSNRVAVTQPVIVQSVNGPAVTVIEGQQVPYTTIGDGAIRCVYLTNGATLSGFCLKGGATRATGSGSDIREHSGGGVWCEGVTAVVSNCILIDNAAVFGGGAYGGTLYNCNLISNRCYSTPPPARGNPGLGGGGFQSTMNNCDLIGNSATDHAGGVYGGSLTNCVLVGNSTYFIGGGSEGSTLDNCLVVSNSAHGFVGGSANGIVVNCTVVGNSTVQTAGGVSGTVLNSIIYYNFPNDYDSTAYAASINYCCTAQLPASGFGNITNTPSFLDLNGGNLRLQSNSPCINAGTNAYVSGATDLDGRPRIVGDTVDMGAYEFQPGTSGVFIGWLPQYGFATDGSSDYADADGDGMNNWQEWRCGTVPTNSLSALRMLSAAPGHNGISVSWQSVSSVSYFLQRGMDLSSPFAFTTIATNIAGAAGVTSFTDTNALGIGPFFYRVGVGD